MVLIKYNGKGVKVRSNKIKEGVLHFKDEPLEVSDETAKFLTKTNPDFTILKSKGGKV